MAVYRMLFGILNLFSLTDLSIFFSLFGHDYFFSSINRIFSFYILTNLKYDSQNRRLRTYISPPIGRVSNVTKIT